MKTTFCLQFFELLEFNSYNEYIEWLMELLLTVDNKIMYTYMSCRMLQLCATCSIRRTCPRTGPSLSRQHVTTTLFSCSGSSCHFPTSQPGIRIRVIYRMQIIGLVWLCSGSSSRKMFHCLRKSRDKIVYFFKSLVIIFFYIWNDSVLYDCKVQNVNMKTSIEFKSYPDPNPHIKKISDPDPDLS